jgi:hypothetical protein
MCSMRTPKRAAALLAATIAASLALAGDALAKGPDAAVITGPDLPSPLTLSYRDAARRATMAKLTTDGDFFRQAFGPASTRPRPDVALGPRYVVVYRVPGPNGNSYLRQSLYPYASGGAITFMAKGQRFWGTRRTRGGWSRPSPSLFTALLEAGLPGPPR